MFYALMSVAGVAVWLLCGCGHMHSDAAGSLTDSTESDRTLVSAHKPANRTPAPTLNSPLQSVSPSQANPIKASAAPMDHSHMPIALPEGVPTPRLSLLLEKDSMSGFNLQLSLQS